jgi:hypothetical protein
MLSRTFDVFAMKGWLDHRLPALILKLPRPEAWSYSYAPGRMSKSCSDKRWRDSDSLASSSDYVSSSTLLSSSTSSNSQTNRETNEARLRFYNLQRRLDELMNDAQALTDSCFVEDALGRQFDKEVAEYDVRAIS